MNYLVDSEKSFYEACLDLPPVVQRLGWKLVHETGFAELLGAQADEPDEECRIFEIVSHRLAESLLAGGLQGACEWPWRIVVFTEGGVTRIATKLPDAAGVAEAEIGERLRQIVDELR